MKAILEFPIPPNYEVDQRHLDLLNHLKREGVVFPWRKLLIVIDGVAGVGKSTLSRYLSWQLGMPVIPLDEFRSLDDVNPLEIREKDLSLFIDARFSQNRPIMIEGVFALDTAKRLGINPDVHIRVKQKMDDGSFKEMDGPPESPLVVGQAKYIKEFDYAKPDYIFETTEEEVMKREFPKRTT